MLQKNKTILAMNDTKQRLQVLLDYWIEHNREHGQEFRDWTQKAASLSSEVSQQLLEAANRMAEVSNSLGKAREVLMKGREKR